MNTDKKERQDGCGRGIPSNLLSFPKVKLVTNPVSSFPDTLFQTTHIP